MPPARPDSESNLCAAALRLAAQHGWNALTLDQIARAAKVPSAQAKKHFGDKNEILPALVRYIGRQSTHGKFDARATPHDRLFEALMARFDALQNRRKGVLAITEDCRRDLSLARLILPAEWREMENVLKAAKLMPDSEVKRPLAVAGLLGVYGWALCCWRRDTTPDMAKTMAGLDRGLRGAEAAARFLFQDR